MHISAITLKEMEKGYRTTLINSLPGFKCLQLVGTISENGHSNVGVFNSIFHVGASPALLGMVFRPNSKDHDTLKNIERTGNYTFNNVNEDFYQKAHQTSARYPSGCSEFVECGLTEFFIPEFESPFVAESTIKIGLDLKEILPLKINDTTILIGEVVHIVLNENLLRKDGYVDHELAKTVTVSGLDSYFNAQHISRLNYAKPNLPTSIL
ncbi:flavin reductase family protein [Pedobacter flavus]|uniref:Flavin reductase n=1 Tax=Pedobacter flavus TaxID=3113906 RepID=A0ABU7H4D9_9SPHI|nr:flavin reductase [Pedobacter sp. VNH31]MEE1885451.1 flavin reductase [Pedobacter sp. VNH31]